MKTIRIALVLALVAAWRSPRRRAGPRRARQDHQDRHPLRHSGPFSARARSNCYRGAKMIIDYVNEKAASSASTRSCRSTATASRRPSRDQRSREAAQRRQGRHPRRRVLERARGAARREGRQAEEVPVDHHRDRRRRAQGPQPQYTFRPQPNGSLFGENTVRYVAHYSQDKLKKAPKTCGPPSSTRRAVRDRRRPRNESEAKKLGMQVVLKEGFSVQAPDLSSLVHEAPRLATRRDLSTTGYNPDIALFLRQARSRGLRVKIYVGHGAGHSQLASLKARLRSNAVA